MHEYSFIESIINQIEKKEDVSFVKLEVGELAGIEAEHLKKHLIEHTGWEVEIKKKESYVECVCGYKGKAKILQRLHDLVVFECPNCGEIPKLIEGKEIKIVKLIYN